MNNEKSAGADPGAAPSLLSCPNPDCEGEGSKIEVNQWPVGWVCECDTCGLRGPNEETPEEAKKSWNNLPRRAPASAAPGVTPTDLTKEIEAVRSYIARSKEYYLDYGVVEPERYLEMAEWGLSRIQHYTIGPGASPTPPDLGSPEVREAVACEIRNIVRTHRVSEQMPAWAECGELIKGQWLLVADRILSVLQNKGGA